MSNNIKAAYVIIALLLDTLICSRISNGAIAVLVLILFMAVELALYLYLIKLDKEADESYEQEQAAKRREAEEKAAEQARQTEAAQKAALQAAAEKSAAQTAAEQAQQAVVQTAVNSAVPGSTVPEAVNPAVQTGTCGEHLLWTLTEDGTLTISGEGAMDDFLLTQSPWDSYTESIHHVDISEGVTTIGAGAFLRCYKLKSVEFSNSVTSIGRRAFCGCGLSEIVIPGNIKLIGSEVFGGCGLLETITFCEGVLDIGGYTFWRGTNPVITLPQSIRHIGADLVCPGPPKKIIYNGTRDQWDQIDIDVGKYSNNWAKPLNTEIVHIQGETRTTQEKERRGMDRKSDFIRAMSGFLAAHGTSHTDVEALLDYIVHKTGNSFESAAEWTAQTDRMQCRYSWCACSFFDDGGGEEGYQHWSLSFIGEEKPDDCIQDEKLKNDSRYDNGSSDDVHDSFCVKDPFGLQGYFKVQYAYHREHFD